MEHTDNESKRVDQEVKGINNEVDGINKKTQKVVRDVRVLEEKVMETLSSQTTLKKGSQSTLQAIEKLKSNIRDKVAPILLSFPFRLHMMMLAGVGRYTGSGWPGPVAAHNGMYACLYGCMQVCMHARMHAYMCACFECVCVCVLCITTYCLAPVAHLAHTRLWTRWLLPLRIVWFF